MSSFKLLNTMANYLFAFFSPLIIAKNEGKIEYLPL